MPAKSAMPLRPAPYPTAPVTAGLRPALNAVFRLPASHPPILGASAGPTAPSRPVLDALGSPLEPVLGLVARPAAPLRPVLDRVLRPGVPLRSLVEEILTATGSLRPLVDEVMQPDVPLTSANAAGSVRPTSQVSSPGDEAYGGTAAKAQRAALSSRQGTGAIARAGVATGPALAAPGRGSALAGPAHARRLPLWPGGPGHGGLTPAAGDAPVQQQTSAGDVTYEGLRVPELRATAPRAAPRAPTAVGGKPPVSPD